MQKIMLALVLLVACSAYAFAGDTDFRGATWGMTADECYDTEKFKSGITKEDYDELKFKGMLFGYVANISYQFKENKLYQGSVIIYTTDRNDAEKIFAAITEKISSKSSREEKVDLFHTVFYVQHTEVSIGILSNGQNHVVVAGYRMLDLESIGLGKYADKPVSDKDLEGF